MALPITVGIWMCPYDPAEICRVHWAFGSRRFGSRLDPPSRRQIASVRLPSLRGWKQLVLRHPSSLSSHPANQMERRTNRICRFAASAATGTQRADRAHASSTCRKARAASHERASLVRAAPKSESAPSAPQLRASLFSPSPRFTDLRVGFSLMRSASNIMQETGVPLREHLALVPRNLLSIWLKLAVQPAASLRCI